MRVLLHTMCNGKSMPFDEVVVVRTMHAIRKKFVVILIYSHYHPWPNLCYSLKTNNYIDFLIKKKISRTKKIKYLLFGLFSFCCNFLCKFHITFFIENNPISCRFSSFAYQPSRWFSEKANQIKMCVFLIDHFEILCFYLTY